MLARQITNTIRGPEHAAKLAVGCLFPSAWLDQPDDKIPGATRRATLEKEYLRKAAGAQPSVAGKLGQFAAVTLVCLLLIEHQGTTNTLPRSHYVSSKKLGSILSTIPRVHIIVGSEDELIAPRRSKQLHDMIPVRKRNCTFSSMQSADLDLNIGKHVPLCGRWRTYASVAGV